MAETMGSGPEMDPKRTNIETKYSTNFEARTPTGDISGQLENIRAMEGLEKAIEAFEYYGLSSFYGKLNPEQQKIFLKKLLEVGIVGDNLSKNVVGVKGESFAVGNDYFYCFKLSHIGLPSKFGRKYDNYAQLIDEITQEPGKEGEGEMGRGEYKDGKLPSFETLKAHEGKQVSFICKDGTKRSGKLIISGVNNETAVLFIKGQFGGEYLRNIKKLSFGGLNGSNDATPPTISTIPDRKSFSQEPKKMEIKNIIQPAISDLPNFGSGVASGSTSVKMVTFSKDSIIKRITPNRGATIIGPEDNGEFKFIAPVNPGPGPLTIEITYEAKNRAGIWTTQMQYVDVAEEVVYDKEKEEKYTPPSKEELLARAQEEYRLMSNNLYLKYFGYNGKGGDVNSEKEFNEAMKREYDILKKKEHDILEGRLKW